MSILLGVIVALLVAVAAQFLCGDGLIRRRQTDVGTRTDFVGFADVDEHGWCMAVFLGVVVAIINFFISKLTYNTLFLAPIMMIVMVVIMFFLMSWWAKSGSEVAEMIPFILLVLILWPVLKATAWATSALFQNYFWASLMVLIPSLLVVAAIGFFIIDYFYFRYRELDVVDKNEADLKAIDRNEEAASRHHGLGILAIIVTTLILVCMLVKCLPWSYFGAPTYSESAIEITPEKTIIEEQIPADTGESESIVVLEEPVNMSQEEKEAVRCLTVEKVSPKQLEKMTLEKYQYVSQLLLEYSLSSNDKSRVEATGFSDALTYGFESKEDAGKFTELETEILRNPVYCVTVVNALKDKTIGGKTIKSFNPWMTEMSEKNKNGVSYWLEYRDESGAIYVTDEYRQYAATLCTWLERLINYGVQTRQTTENWCLNNSALNNERAGIKASYQYAKEALILAYVGKNEGGNKEAQGLLAIGFNIHDKRPEFYGGTPENPTVYRPPLNPTPVPQPTPEPTPQPTPEPTPTPMPEPTPEPTPTPPPYNKDKTKGTQGEIVAPNDDPGPGPDTNNGVGATESTKDQPENSNHYDSYEQYKENMEELEKINKEQKTGKDDNTPSTSKEEAAKQLTGDSTAPVTVDNNGDKGTGYGSIDKPTEVTEPAKAADTGESISDSPGGAWGGPLD